MKKTRNLFISLIMVFMAWNGSIAQDQPAMTNQELTEMMKFVGYWEGPATQLLNGQKYSFTYYINFKIVADGNGLIMSEWYTHPELGMLDGYNLIGYNANDKQIHWFSIDNFDSAHEHLGTWLTPDHFFMEAHETVNGKSMIEKINMVMKTANQIEFSSVSTIDGIESNRIEAVFNRNIK